MENIENIKEKIRKISKEQNLDLIMGAISSPNRATWFVETDQNDCDKQLENFLTLARQTSINNRIFLQIDDENPIIEISWFEGKSNTSSNPICNSLQITISSLTEDNSDDNKVSQKVIDGFESLINTDVQSLAIEIHNQLFEEHQEELFVANIITLRHIYEIGINDIIEKKFNLESDLLDGYAWDYKNENKFIYKYHNTYKEKLLEKIDKIWKKDKKKKIAQKKTEILKKFNDYRIEESISKITKDIVKVFLKEKYPEWYNGDIESYVYVKGKNLSK